MTGQASAAEPDDWFDRVPKVELHLHLEGAIPHDAMWELVQGSGGDPDVPDKAALEERFRFRDFAHFIEVWKWKNKFLRDYADFTFIAQAVARDLARQNVRYAEMFYSPSRFADQGLDPQRLTQSIREGLDAVSGIDVGLIPDLVRDHGPQRAETTLSQIAEAREYGLVGIGMGGSEQRFPAGPFAGVYARARSLEFRTTVHAGEAAGAESIWASLDELRVDRIGHATRAIEDPRLVKHLAHSQTPLELCPLSNVRTRVVQQLSDHPLKHFVEEGLMITINTDDPAMFGNSLAQELRELENTFSLDRSQIRSIILAGITASWLDESAKTALMQSFEADPNW